MCRRLKERSLVDYILISYKSQTSDLMAQRDTKQDNELLTDLPADGNTQGKQLVSNCIKVTQHLFD